MLNITKFLVACLGLTLIGGASTQSTSVNAEKLQTKEPKPQLVVEAPVESTTDQLEGNWVLPPEPIPEKTVQPGDNGCCAPPEDETIWLEDFCGNRYLYEENLTMSTSENEDYNTSPEVDVTNETIDQVPPMPLPPKPVQPGDNGCCAPPEEEIIWITGDDVCDTPEVMQQLHEEMQAQ